MNLDKPYPYVIPLSRGAYTAVDPEDYERLNYVDWFLSTNGYAVRTDGATTKRIYMHRVIMNPPMGKVVDHLNHNKLDNRRSNLRVVTQIENGHNSVLSKSNTSGFIGVHWLRREQRWCAAATLNYKKVHIGSFKRIEDAIAARSKWDKEAHA